MHKKTLWLTLALTLVAVLLFGCGGGAQEETPAIEEPSGSADFPAKDPAEPFALDEKGTVTITNDQAYTIQVQRADGTNLFTLDFKKNGVIDPTVDFTVQAVPFEIPEEYADQFVPVGERAFELHAADDQGYGFALRPKLQIYVTNAEISAATEAGASLDTIKGNLTILYKEQRSPKWVPQTSISVDEDTKVVTVSNVAGAGAWMLVAKK